MTPSEPLLHLSTVVLETLTREWASGHREQLLKLGDDLKCRSWTMRNLLADELDKWRLSLVMRSGDEPIGCAIISRKPEGLHVHHFIVGTTHRGQGHGTKLVLRVLDEARRENAVRIIHHIPQSATRAIDFFLGYGFSLGKFLNDGCAELIWRNPGE